MRDELSTAFTVEEEPGAAGSGLHRRTWLDTFDWRLYQAGLTLQLRAGQRGGRLVLSKADGAPQAEQPVTALAARRPGLAEDLPARAGPGPDRGLTSPRALLPVVTAASTVSVIRLLNADDKTVARLVVDRVTVTAPAGTQRAAPAELPPRLAVAEVRGYPGQARRRRACWPARPASRTPARACSSRR